MLYFDVSLLEFDLLVVAGIIHLFGSLRSELELGEGSALIAGHG